MWRAPRHELRSQGSGRGLGASLSRRRVCAGGIYDVDADDDGLFVISRAVNWFDCRPASDIEELIYNMRFVVVDSGVFRTNIDCMVEQLAAEGAL